MDSQTFRKLAGYAADSVSKFLTEFPGIYVEMRTTMKDGETIVVALNPKAVPVPLEEKDEDL